MVELVRPNQLFVVPSRRSRMNFDNTQSLTPSAKANRPISREESSGRTFLVIASFGESLLRFRLELITRLVEAGFTVHAAAPDLDETSAVRQALERRGVRVHQVRLQRTGLNPLQDAATLGALYILMKRVRPTHVLSYTIKPVVYGCLAARLAAVPHRFALITGLGYAFTTAITSSLRSRALRGIAKALYRAALRGCHMVFFQNPDDQALFRSLRILKASAPSTVVNGSGVDLSHYPAQRLPQGTQFLMVARLLGDKGVREFAAAAKQVLQRYPWATFAVAGWIDDSPDAIGQEELDQWVQDGTVRYLGRLNDVRPALAACSVFVLPSYYPEGTPRTVLEAMATGRAIITTDAPGCRETVLPGVNGFLVPVRSVDALVRAMVQFIEQPDLIAQMAVESRRIAEQKYDVHAVNAMMLSEMSVEQESPAVGNAAGH